MPRRPVLTALAVAAFVLVGALPSTAQPRDLESCVPAELRDDALTFPADDGVELSGQIFGRGTAGVLLVQEPLELVCEWVPLARQLADDGYQVLLYEKREYSVQENRDAFDRDVLGAARELQRRGATSIIAGGAGTGATVIASVAERIPGLSGMFLLTPFQAYQTRRVDFDALSGIGAVQVPTLVVVGTGDLAEGVDLDPVEHAREVAGAAANAELEVVPGDLTFARLTDNPAVRDRVRTFVRETLPPPTFLDRWLGPIAGGVVLLAMLAAVGVVVLRRCRRPAETAPLD